MTWLEFGGTVLGAGGLTTLIMGYMNRKKTKAEAHQIQVQSEQISQDVMGKVLQTVNTQLGILQRTIDRDKKHINTLTGLTEKLKRDHEDCELSNNVLTVELDAVRKMIVENSLAVDKVKIAILDDNKLDTFMFEFKLKRISFLDVHSFNEVDPFMEYIETRPALLLMDYHIGSGLTIESIIIKILSIENYSPKIVVITADTSPELRESLAKLGVWRFFVKKGPYVNLVTKQILDYLGTVIK